MLSSPLLSSIVAKLPPASLSITSVALLDSTKPSHRVALICVECSVTSPWCPQ